MHNRSYTLSVIYDTISWEIRVGLELECSSQKSCEFICSRHIVSLYKRLNHKLLQGLAMHDGYFCKILWDKSAKLTIIMKLITRLAFIIAYTLNVKILTVN